MAGLVWKANIITYGRKEILGEGGYIYINNDTQNDQVIA